MTRQGRKPKTANSPLPLTTTQDLIQDLYALTYEGIGEFDFGYLGEVFLSKFAAPSKENATARRAKAIEKWLATEVVNETTNLRLRNPALDDNIIFGEITVGRFFTKLQEVVLRIIGGHPSLDLSNGGFSGGATTSKSRRDGHPAIKFRDQAHATPRAWELFFTLIDEGSPWANHIASNWEYVVVRGNALFTVPKTSDIDRVACKEPDINVFIQKGFGDQLRRKLRSVGINLNDQSVNANLAREGSISRDIATLDLSSASDSVTCALVERVMPSGWLLHLSAVRSQMTEIDGEWHLNQMFSSMGNGFTFELESLLFYAICRCVQYFTGVKGVVSVYGDDLIVPHGIVENLVEALQYCGFRTNPDKSFWDSSEPFRESCGSHWYAGSDVTPFYIRGPVQTLSDLILLLNQLALWGSRNGGIVDPRVEALHIKWRKLIPEELWGGQNPMSRYSLVTGHRPRKRLRPVINEVSHSHVGGLLAWLHSTSTRVGPPKPRSPISEATDTAGFHRLSRNVESVDTTKPYFAGLSDA